MGFLKNVFAAQKFDAVIIGKGSPGATRVKRIRQVSVAVDLPSIAAGAAGTQTATVTGARAGDLVVPIPPTALAAGLVVGACIITANDTVTIRVGNLTAGAIDEPSRTWQFLHIALG